MSGERPWLHGRLGAHLVTTVVDGDSGGYDTSLLRGGRNLDYASTGRCDRGELCNRLPDPMLMTGRRTHRQGVRGLSGCLRGFGDRLVKEDCCCWGEEGV